MTTELTIHTKLNKAQARFFAAFNGAKRRAETTYIDLEGAVRCGKTRAVLWAVRDLCLEYPGIQILLCRYTQDALDTQLRPMFYAEVPRELLGRWEPKEEHQEILAGEGKPPSGVYLRALKSSEITSRYGKIQGLTLAVVAIVQAEEVPEDYYQHLKPRLSQKGFPHLMLLDANPPGEDHWLASEFPDGNTIPGRVVIRGSVYDNRENLGEDYIRDLERQYPVGHPLRARFVDGRRGIGYLGKPIYGGLFNRGVHVREVGPNPELPIYEAWDFGRAAVLWAQFPLGQRIYLGELMGTPGEFLETFVPKALDLRVRLFGDATFESCCDPAGADRSSHGSARTAVAILAENGVTARFVVGSNFADMRTAAIQAIAGHLARMTPEGPGLVLHPRCRTLAAGFEAGYVHDEHAPSVTQSPSLIRPKKDGTFDHLANCSEYLELNFGGARPSRKDVEKMERRRQVLSQKDRDPYYIRPRRTEGRGRGGY